MTSLKPANPLNPEALEPMYLVLKQLSSHPDGALALFRNPVLDKQVMAALRLGGV